MEKNKKVFLIIGLVVFVNLGLFIYFRFQDQTKPVSTPSLSESASQSDQSVPSDQQPVDQSGDQSAGQDLPPADVDQPSARESDFSIEGILIGDGNPWTIIYDDPVTGSPAATLELVFTDSSLCDFGQGDTSCFPMYFEVGTGIQATGQKDGSKLTISQIDRAVNLMPPQ